ncbi:MAG: VOC family protein [bacterium]|nr:VOC family protein [bacterium]MBK8127463.1 VOC family protein [bacterium]
MGCLKGLSEVILYVENMQEMVEFYRDAMGLTIAQPAGVTDFRRQEWIELDTGVCRLCLHSGGKRRVGQDSASIVFRVNDLEVARDELTERGVPMGEPRMVAPNIWICEGEDPEGNRFSIEYVGQKQAQHG